MYVKLSPLRSSLCGVQLTVKVSFKFHYSFSTLASFGVVGWLLLIGFSIIVARHGKQILGADCCASKAWLRVSLELVQLYN